MLILVVYHVVAYRIMAYQIVIFLIVAYYIVTLYSIGLYAKIIMVLRPAKTIDTALDIVTVSMQL